MADPVSIPGVTGIHVYETPDTGNGAAVNIALMGTPYVLQVGSPLVDGKLPGNDVTVLFPKVN